MEKIFTYSKRVDEILMKFSEKMWLTIILKVTKKTKLHPLSRRYSFGKIHRGVGGGVNLTHLAFSGLIMAYIFEQVCIANLPWKIFHECVWN